MSNATRVCLLAAVLAVALCSGIAGADVIHSTFGPGDTFYEGSSWLVSGSSTEYGLVWTAHQFTTPGTDYYFDKLEIIADLWEGTNSIIVSLLADNAGLTGTAIESFDLVDILTADPGIISMNSQTHPLLQSGTPYWVSVAPGADDTDANWWFGFDDEAALHAGNMGSGWMIVDDPDYASGAYRVTGTAVPEPSSLLAMLAGMGSLGGLLLRRRGR